MRKKKSVDKDEAQSSLDSFTSNNIPPMPDLDSLAKADKIMRKEKLNSSYDDTEGLNTFEMPSMQQVKQTSAAPTGLVYHDLEKMYPN